MPTEQPPLLQSTREMMVKTIEETSKTKPLFYYEVASNQDDDQHRVTAGAYSHDGSYRSKESPRPVLFLDVAPTLDFIIIAGLFEDALTPD